MTLRGLLDPVPKQLVEVVIVAGCLALLGVYHFRLLRRLRSRPESTAMGRHYLTRAAWLKWAAANGRELLVVQTMRNLIMSASFLASTAVLLAAGFFGGVFSTDGFSEIVYSLNFLGMKTPSLLVFKALLLTATFLAAFFSFSLAIRSFNHLSFMIHLASVEELERGDNKGVADEMRRGALHYALGMRAFYIAIPLTLWFFGPIWMLAGSVLLVPVLSRID